MASALEVPNFNVGVQPTVAAIDNGGTNTRLWVYQGNNLLSQSAYPTPHDVVEAMDFIGTGISRATGNKPVDAIGMAIAGQVEGGTIVQAGQLKAYQWCEYPIAASLSSYTHKSEGGVVMLGDCAAAAYDQMEVNRKSGGPDIGTAETISTGLGSGKFNKGKLEGDEPGHDNYKPGAMCGCGKEGCLEAHVSGSGIERKFGIKAEHLPADLWQEVMTDMIQGHANLLNRYENEGFVPQQLNFFGSVALRGRGIRVITDVPAQLAKHGVLSGLYVGLLDKYRTGEISYLPEIAVATNEDNCGIMGAHKAAVNLLKS